MAKRDRFARFAAGARCAAFAACVVAWAAQAQVPGSVSDYRLPPAPEPNTAVQGPVDPQDPATRPRTLRTAPETPPAETSEQRPTPAVDAQPGSRPAPRAAPVAPPSRMRPAPEPAPAATPTPVLADTPRIEATAQSDAPTPPPVATVTPAPAANRVEDGWLIPGALALVALFGGLLWLRRRRTGNPALRDTAAAQDNGPSPPVRIADPPATANPVPAAPTPLPAPAITTALPALDFQPRALQFSVVYATLAYTLDLANPGQRPTGPITIRADLTAAHGARDRHEQLAPSPRDLALRHELPGLAPGESLSLKGEVRLPLDAIMPIRHGKACLLIPLARFHLGGDEDGELHIFTFGEPPLHPDGALIPFRLNDGPRHVRALEARRIDAAQWLTLDPLRRTS